MTEDELSQDYLADKLAGRLPIMYQDHGGQWDNTATCRAYRMQSSMGRRPQNYWPASPRILRRIQSKKGTRMNLSDYLQPNEILGRDYAQLPNEEKILAKLKFTIVDESTLLSRVPSYIIQSHMSQKTFDILIKVLSTQKIDFTHYTPTLTAPIKDISYRNTLGKKGSRW